MHLKTDFKGKNCFSTNKQNYDVFLDNNALQLISAVFLLYVILFYFLKNVSKQEYDLNTAL